MRRRAVVVSVVTIVWVAASSVRSVALADAPVLELKTAGNAGAAREMLRFAPKEGTKQTVVMAVSNSAARGVAGKVGKVAPNGTMTMTADLVLEGVKPDGRFRYGF